MNRTAVAILVCVCALFAAPARADDGGWWDTFWKWDTHFFSYGSEIHLACLDGQGRRVIGCEEWFKGILKIPEALARGKSDPFVHNFRVVKDPNGKTPEEKFLTLESFDPIKHEIDFRLSYSRSHGKRYDAPDPPIGDPINAVRPMLMYRFHDTRFSAVGAGVGGLFIWGRGANTTRWILTPASYVFYPLPRAQAFFVRAEVNYIPHGFSASDFGDGPDPANPQKAVATFERRPDWNSSLTFGFDLRRIGSFAGAR